MAIEVLDTLGLKCPQPIIKIAVKSADMQPGDILEVIGDCPDLEEDVRLWCKRLNKSFLSIKESKDGKKRIKIQF